MNKHDRNIKNRLLYTGMILTLLLNIPYAEASHTHTEADYQAVWCNYHKGDIEVKLNDYTRADCITKTHAIEFDFANKWAESIGQALYYSIKTNKRAGIVLIIEEPLKDNYYLKRVLEVAKKHKIDVWTMQDINDTNSIVYKRGGLFHLWKK